MLSKAIKNLKNETVDVLTASKVAAVKVESNCASNKTSIEINVPSKKTITDLKKEFEAKIEYFAAKMGKNC